MNNSKYKQILVVCSVLALLGIGGVLAFNNDVDEEQPDTSLSQEQQETLVSDYIEENISELSTEPEALGGTFYVTNISFTGANSGTVEYEDGHIALIADFNYSVEEGTVSSIDLSNARER